MTDTGFVNPQELIARAGIRKGMRVADFGSGSGEIAVVMAQAVGEQGIVTALDVLSSAIESVQARAKGANLENITAVRANLEVSGGSTLQDASQDLVFMANILWQSSKKQEIVLEATRILTSGGVLFCIEWKKDSTAGPPANMRISEDELRQIIAVADLQAAETFPAGSFHYGLIARKP